jgi:hypothetical protein
LFSVLSGKVFPKLKRKGSRLAKDGQADIPEEPEVQMEEEASDYVFRIISTFKPENLRKYITQFNQIPPGSSVLG